jgi:hypothetical protein
VGLVEAWAATTTGGLPKIFPKRAASTFVFGSVAASIVLKGTSGVGRAAAVWPIASPPTWIRVSLQRCEAVGWPTKAVEKV